MARRKSISISLAAKCQLLFGLAVLVIIAGALAVPWQRMEQLAGQPNVKAARLAADILFREVHTNASTKPATTKPTTEPATITAPATTPSTNPTTQPDWNEITLTPEATYPRPRIFTIPSPTADFPATSEAAEDPIATQALKNFRNRAQETEYGKVVNITDKSGERTRVYRYAAAVRMDQTCIRCHTDYAEWLQPRTASTNSTMTAVPTTTPTAPEATATWPVVAIVRVDVPYLTDENQLLLNRIVIVVSGMLGGTLAIVVFYLITSRLILQPVRVLKNTAEKVAQGDLKIRSAISTGDEFQHLSETFNTMLATLQASQDQLEATNRSLDTRVGELAQSNVDLFEANRMKSEFLTNVTHELRTPLNAIIGFADLMADTAKDSKQQRYSENIRISAKQLLDLINDLLDLAKIEAGKLVLREDRVNVADVCEAMANFMKPLAQKKNIDLQLNLATDLPLITTDPGRFQQILYNFLSNAIKFTPNEGKVTIIAKTEPVEPATPPSDTLVPQSLSASVPSIRISVTDTGPGISPEDQKLIFEKFKQLDGSVTRQHSGTGLGLAISRELAAMLGARIEVTSTPNKGATFSLIIPPTNPQNTITIHPTLENA
jgi:signal transduction histidine kinase